MMATGASARAISLSRNAPGRLGPSALQSSFGRLDTCQTIMPCGGLTRRQIDGASFAGWAGLASWLGRRLAPRTEGQPGRG